MCCGWLALIRRDSVHVPNVLSDQSHMFCITGGGRGDQCALAVLACSLLSALRPQRLVKINRPMSPGADLLLSQQ